MVKRVLFHAGVITWLLACPYFADAKDHKVMVPRVGALCILESEDAGDWAGIYPATLELWQDPSTKFCAVPTDGLSAAQPTMVVECIMWEARRRDRWFVTLGDKPPPPVPPNPPPNVVVPNKFGVGEIVYRQALLLTDRSKMQSYIENLRRMSAEALTVTSDDQMDAMYAKYEKAMDLVLDANWTPLRQAAQKAFSDAWDAGKIKSYADQSAAIKEYADALSLVPTVSTKKGVKRG